MLPRRTAALGSSCVQSKCSSRRKNTGSYTHPDDANPEQECNDKHGQEDSNGIACTKEAEGEPPEDGATVARGDKFKKGEKRERIGCQREDLVEVTEALL